MKLLAALCLGLLMACGPAGSETSPLGGAVSGLEERSSVDVSASSLDFGEQRVGTSTVQTLVVKNTGSTEFKVTSISINGNAFSVSPSSPFTLPPASSYNLSVTFTPTAEGAATGNLTLTTNDPDRSTLLVSLSGKGVKPQLVVNPSAIDFGAVRVGTSVAKGMVVSNTGSGSLTLMNITLGTAPFSLPSPPLFPITLKAGESLSLMVQFQPSSQGPSTDNLKISSNDPGSSTLVVPLSGQGVKPQLVLDPSVLDFGSARVGKSINAAVKMSNPGTGPLTLTSFSLSGSSSFSLASPPSTPLTLAPGASQTLTVTFLPTSQTRDSATLTLSSDDPDLSHVALPLLGKGVKPQLLLSATALDFGSIRVSDFKTLNVVVSNVGSDSLTVTSIALSGSSFFTIASLSVPITLGPGAGQILTVRFLADYEGAFSAKLTLSTDDPEQPSVSVPLSGKAVRPQLVVSPPSFDFGPRILGTTGRFPVQLTNLGSGSVVLKSVFFLGGSSAFSLPVPPTLPLVLEPGASQTLQVAFTPTTQEAFKTNLVISSDDPATPTANVSVAGTGVAAVLVLGSSKLDFGTQAVGSTTTRPVTVSNVGASPLHLTAISSTVGAPFSEAFAGPFDLQPGTSREFPVSFTPSAEGSFEATLKFTSDSASGPESLVHLTGVATQSLPLLGPDSLEFGTQRVGSSGPAQKTTLYNTGSAPLHVSAISVTEGAPFTVTPSTAFDLAPGAHQDLSVTFTPASEGDFKATLTLGGDKEGASIGTVELSGTGAKEEVAATGCYSSGTVGSGMLGALALLLLGARRTRAR